MFEASPLYLFGFLGRNHPLYDINIIYKPYRTIMALFGFSDISFNKSSGNRIGPLSSLSGSQFETTTLRYPLDIGNTDKSHYVIFYIREQKESSFKRTTVSDFSDSGGIGSLSLVDLTNPQKLATNYGNELMGKINNGLNQLNQKTGGILSGLTSAISKAAGGVIGGITGSIGNIFGQANISLGGGSAATQALIDNSIKRITGGSLNFLRTTKLTTDAIALYMPDTLQYTYAQSYDQLSLGGELAGQALAGGKSIYDAFQSGSAEGIGAIGKTAAEIAKQKAGSGVAKLLGSEQTGQAILAATGRVQNPMLEMIYKSPNFRTFQFDFTFYPRDEREALEVQRILERLRFHQAPELMPNAGGFLIPPSEFDIKFYNSGKENPNIPQIATCVLTTLDVNYAPNGWSAYETPGENNPSLGRTGMPVSIQATLQFQEMTYLTKADFRSDLANADTLARGN
jgi:hypothetical protein